MGLWKQIKASRRATALRLDGYMLWEEPLHCPYCKNTEWKVLRGRTDFASISDAMFARGPGAAAEAADSNPYSLYSCRGCGRAYMVFEDRQYDQLFFKPRPLNSTVTMETKEQPPSDLAAEKAAQIERARVVLKPLVFVVALIVFALCFWRYDLGLVLSIGTAILVYPIMLVGVALPVGYVLGKRAARRRL